MGVFTAILGGTWANPTSQLSTGLDSAHDEDAEVHTVTGSAAHRYYGIIWHHYYKSLRY